MQAQTSIVVTLYYTLCLLPVKQHLHIVCIIIICCQCFTVMILIHICTLLLIEFTNLSKQIHDLVHVAICIKWPRGTGAHIQTAS